MPSQLEFALRSHAQSTKVCLDFPQANKEPQAAYSQVYGASLSFTTHILSCTTLVHHSHALLSCTTLMHHSRTLVPSWTTLVHHSRTLVHHSRTPVHHSRAPLTYSRTLLSRVQYRRSHDAFTLTRSRFRDSAAITRAPGDGTTTIKVESSA